MKVTPTEALGDIEASGNTWMSLLASTCYQTFTVHGFIEHFLVSVFINTFYSITYTNSQSHTVKNVKL